MELTHSEKTNKKAMNEKRTFEHLYLCDGKACDRNCAENGYAECKHTHDESHAKTKCRRDRRFRAEEGCLIEKER